jgi:phosphomannomutase/phosphoglucomutase
MPSTGHNFAQEEGKMNPHIFREYDIRGEYPKELNLSSAQILGKAIGTYYHQHGAKRITLGRDVRLSSPELRDGLMEGLLDTGLQVIDLGVVPTPLVYFSLHHLQVDGGVQITGSHNPPEYNGFKICLGDRSIFGEEIQVIRRILEKGEFQKGHGSSSEADIITPYVDYVSQNIRLGERKIKVALDAGNGTAGLVAPKLYRMLGAKVLNLFCEVDGEFPSHHPDPTVPENLRCLRETVLVSKADLGIAYDGDADRIGVIDPKGEIVWGDQLLIIFSRELLKRYPKGKIIGEVKCSQVLYDDIAKNGGIPIMWKTGHSLIKDKLKKEGALLAGEMSGHIFFGERYFGFDDAIYAGARLLEILSNTHKSLPELLEGIPKMLNTPEIRVDCPDEMKFRVIQELIKEFQRDYQVVDVDGARVIFPDGWGLVRASNTQPVLVLRFESKTEEGLMRIQDLFRKKLAPYGVSF